MTTGVIVVDVQLDQMKMDVLHIRASDVRSWYIIAEACFSSSWRSCEIVLVLISVVSLLCVYLHLLFVLFFISVFIVVVSVLCFLPHVC